MAKVTAEEAMSMAIEEGFRGLGFVSPTPAVGCAILSAEDELIGLGYHKKYGEAHAEVNALNSVTEASKLKGAKVFVSLEPCAHEGKTPSCAKALAKLPIAEVHYALEDPNPLVAGKGLEILRQAGIRVIHNQADNHRAEALAEVFFTNMKQNRCFLALKVATSLDGQMALENGQSQWITGEKARAAVQVLRGHYDAVMVGVDTFLTDNPRLDSRAESFSSKTNYAIVIDRTGRGLASLQASNLLKPRPSEKVIWVTDSPEVSRFQVSALTGCFDPDGKLLLQKLTEALYQHHKISSVMVEGGRKLFAAMMTSDLCDRVYLFQSNKIIGRGRQWSSEIEVSNLDQSFKLSGVDRVELGDDQLITGRLRVST